MIRVRERPEPADFDRRVRNPGRTWLAEHPDRRDLHPYWRACLPDLAFAYKHVCSYFGTRVSPITGASSTDHFIAKSLDRDQAYEWKNYRFACARMNAKKGVAAEVVDPFEVADGCFEIVFSTFQVRPSIDVEEETRARVTRTIDRLDLNAHECLEERRYLWSKYKQHGMVKMLIEEAPFLALEACRQRLLHDHDAKVRCADIRA